MVGVANPAPGSFKAPGRLLVTQVDTITKHSPTRRFGLIPNGTEVEQGFRDMTFRDLSRAVNAMSWWIDGTLGRPQPGERIAYLGNNDVRYIIFMLACHKTGYTIFLPSTRLSDEAYNHVLKETKCTHLLFSQEKLKIASRLRTLDWKMKFQEVPSVADILNNGSGTNHFEFSQTYDEVVDKIAFIIHSSGTTGMPKPVPLTHGFLGTMDFAAVIPLPPGRSSAFFNDLSSDDPNHKELVLSSTPYFHLMGLTSFFESIFHNIPFVASPERLLSVGFLTDLIRHTKPTVTILPPSILEDMSYSDEALACLSTLKFICYGGAPLSPEVGEKLVRYTQLRSAIGSSEMGIICSMVPEGEDTWGYFEWNPFYQVDMQLIGDGLYELVIPRVEHSLVMHGIFHTFPELKEYRSKDLYTRHPTNPKLWKYHGRFDDVIVLSNGEKLNPISLEKIVEGHPSVHRALLIGQRRFQTCLLIEPDFDKVATPADVKEFINMIWPVVQEANATVPDYGQIVKSMIRLSSREKPFKLTAKGTTQRHAVNKDYAEEIEQIYAAQDKQLVMDLPSAITPETVCGYLQNVICKLTGRQNIKASDDLYSMGLDSLQAIQLSKILKNSVSSHNPGLNTDHLNVQEIYAHPTAEGLTNLLLGILDKPSTPIATVSRSVKIAQLIAKYTNDLHVRESDALPQLPALVTVILTGSTGSLGSYILDDLLRNPQVAKIYCFNRSEGSLPRQMEGFQEKGLQIASLNDPNKVEFLHVHFGEPHFGLPDRQYNELLNTVDVIIHNAWKVNFNHPVSSFEDPHLKGVREFVRFSQESRYRAHLAFVSSVSTIGAWKPSGGATAVPEVPMETADATLEQGYGESKYIGESICVEASKKAGVPTSILRVGQIAGPDTRLGVWNPHEWVPSLIKTSKATGKVPFDLGGYPIDWVSVDTLAKIVNELVLGRRASLAETRNAVFHLVNPSRTTWASLVPAIQERYPVQPVPLVDWVADLETTQDPSDGDVQDKPALKLLAFFRGLANNADVLSADISVERSRKGSETMASLDPVSPAQMANWLNQWGF
ncbi:putative NRPS-like enzyme [Aspergillus aculeatinus CBS 121060]|uniref:NRPS-like enzyme n=1 Tax=Aspergillus aculeatinus CBS 121060 TaxID=1448322 RepID=A0ACD1GST2_9EURO|nr:NRPS-like enzyme [Aspergillus aculeatinus CBS 121060]RAH64512.1 NRPS-like enzyme [Aspergillus aculeatinus CBS 121060]